MLLIIKLWNLLLERSLSTYYTYLSCSQIYFHDGQINLYIQVAAISGDARRALEICRRAAEITDYRIKNQVSQPDTASTGTNYFNI